MRRESCGMSRFHRRLRVTAMAVPRTGATYGRPAMVKVLGVSTPEDRTDTNIIAVWCQATPDQQLGEDHEAAILDALLDLSGASLEDNAMVFVSGTSPAAGEFNVVAGVALAADARETAEATVRAVLQSTLSEIGVDAVIDDVEITDDLAGLVGLE